MKPPDEELKKIAKNFHKDMQDLVNKSDGFSSISVRVGNETPIIIAEKQTQKQTKMKTQKLQLECILTDTDKLTLSKELTDHISSQSRAEDDMKAFSTQKKAEISGHNAHINRIAQLLNSGKEYRDVLCNIVFNQKDDEVVWVRQDTGEITKRLHPIPENMRQEELELNSED
jgi:hypothetical protein